MSDINAIPTDQTLAARSTKSLEARRDVSRSTDPLLETATNEVRNASAQVVAPSRADETDQTKKDGRDPFERAAEALEAILPAEEFANTNLRIQLDEESGRFIYQTVDKESGEIVKQFPPEDILELIQIFRGAEGLAVDDRV